MKFSCVRVAKKGDRGEGQGVRGEVRGARAGWADPQEEGIDPFAGPTGSLRLRSGQAGWADAQEDGIDRFAGPTGSLRLRSGQAGWADAQGRDGLLALTISNILGDKVSTMAEAGQAKSEGEDLKLEIRNKKSERRNQKATFADPKRMCGRGTAAQMASASFQTNRNGPQARHGDLGLKQKAIGV